MSLLGVQRCFVFRYFRVVKVQGESGCDASPLEGIELVDGRSERWIGGIPWALEGWKCCHEAYI